MARTIHEKNYMKLVSNGLNLPVFLVSRNRIKSNLTPLRNYIGSKRLHYIKSCNKENETETATLKKYKHIHGLEPTPPVSCPTKRILKQSRDLGKKGSWIMAPNMYKLEKQPFSDRKGLGGAFWPKSQPRPNKAHEPQKKYYDVDKKDVTCNRYKNIFKSNARSHRSGSRLMVSDLSSCYRNPNDPAPNTYYPQNYTLTHNVSPPIISKPPNPHTFLRRSSVPEKQTYMSLKNKFTPGPGRYEVRYPNFCPCTWRLVFIPNLQLLIDHEKRLKFRRRPYMKIKARFYCAPDWRHVEGHGHRHIFKLPNSKKLQLERERRERKSKDTNIIDIKDAMKPIPKLYADAHYIGMINDPNRELISFRKKPLRDPQPKIVFNCLKRYSRRGKITAVNKKVAFNSGQERLLSGERPAILTFSQLKKLIESLPLERQLRDQPIMRKKPEEIKSRLSAVPKYMQQEYELETRKRLFTFLPLPGIKRLVTENDVRTNSGIKFFDKILDCASFLKKELHLTSTSQNA